MSTFLTFDAKGCGVELRDNNGKRTAKCSYQMQGGSAIITYILEDIGMIGKKSLHRVKITSKATPTNNGADLVLEPRKAMFTELKTGKSWERSYSSRQNLMERISSERVKNP
jgi:hypothetical protein